MENVETTRVGGLLGWLEEEQHQNKAQIGRLQQQVDQLSNLAREQTMQIRSAQEEMAATRSQLSRLSAIEDLLRQMRESLARVQSNHTEHLQADDKEEKRMQVEIERAKQSISEIALRIDSIYSEFEPLLGKVQGMADSAKRHQEAVVDMAHSIEGIQHLSDSLLTRVQIASDHGRRNENEIERFGRHLETLQTQDDVAATRLQILADHVKQIDDQVEAVMSEEKSRVDLNERFQVLRLEQQRLDKLLTEIVPMIDVYSVRLDEHTRELKQVEERRQLTASDLKELRQLLLEHTARIEGNVVGIQELEQRHKRRQIQELELQSNELKDRIAKLKGQVL